MEVARLIDPERVVKLRRAVFEEMIERGLFHEDDRIQLLDGVLVQMRPPGDAHAREIVKLTNVLARRIGDRADIAPQVPFRAGDYSRPEPDLALWPLAEDSVIERHTEPQGDRYTRIEPLRSGQVVRLIALPDVEIPVADLLPRI